MVRNIYVGDNYSRKVVTPLITTDQNSYRIIWDTKCKNGVFKITAVKSDNSAVFDFGELSDEGVATYIIANNMYDTEGPLKLFLTIVEDKSITTCREISFTVREGADEATFAENNANPINSLAMQVAANSNENNSKLQKLKDYDETDVYILKEGEDIIVSENIVTQLLNHDFSEYDAIAFPEGITEINLPDTNNGGNTPLTANKVIMPNSLKKIGMFSFSNYVKRDDEGNLIESSIVVDVKEYILNEGLETIGSYAFADNIYMEKVNIPESIKVIDRGAFQYCDSLKGIFIPATVTKIGDGNFTTTSFSQEKATVIYGYAGSTAEIFAKENGYNFVNIGSNYSEELDSKVDKEEGKGLSTNDYTTTEKNKLQQTTKDIASIGADIAKLVTEKVDKVDGKQLSTEDFTTEYKNKLEGLENYELPDDVVKDAKYVHTDNNYTTEEKEKLAGLENCDNIKIRDEINIELYGTTDIHILTDDDICITNDGIFEAQKRPVIEYDVVIIPYGVKTIFPRYPDYDNNDSSLFYPEGIYPIYIKAKKIIFPSTLINIYGSLDISTDEFNAVIDGECVLNEGVEIINLINGTNASGASLGKITIPETIKAFSVWGYYQDIIIPKSVNKFSFWSAYELDCNLYVYNPVFDFSSFEVGQVFSPEDYEGNGVVYGYAGSTAEIFAKEHGYNFVNMGSDYSEQLGDIESAVDHILELDNALLGGDAL